MLISTLSAALITVIPIIIISIIIVTEFRNTDMLSKLEC